MRRKNPKIGCFVRQFYYPHYLCLKYMRVCLPKLTLDLLKPFKLMLQLTMN